MRKKIVRGTIIVLINIIAIVLMLEALLRYIDPLGAFGYYASVLAVQNHSYTTDEGYGIEAGRLRLPGFWTLTMLDDNTRLVPTASPQNCKTQ